MTDRSQISRGGGVRRLCDSAPSMRDDLGHDGIEAIRAPCREHHGCPLRGEGTRGRGTDSAAGTSYDGNLARQPSGNRCGRSGIGDLH